MLATKPEFIQGDKLTFKQYFAALKKDKRLLFSSHWTWWKKTTLLWSVPLLLADLILFSSLVYQDLQAAEEIHWMLITSLMSLPFVFFLPPIWARSYYSSFVTSRKIADALNSFIAQQMPEATNIRRLAHNNYILSWNGLEFEVAYSLIPTRKTNGLPSHFQECFLLCLYYVPSPDQETEILNEEGTLSENFLNLWETYCSGKESCKSLVIDEYAIYSFIPLRELGQRSPVKDTLEQIQYLTKRFGLVPLYCEQFVIESVKSWLFANDQEVPDDIVALHIGIFEGEGCFTLYLIGSKTYDPNDDDWACNEDFIPDEKYYEVPLCYLADSDWKAFQHLVKTIVEEYLAENAADEDSIFCHRIVTVGFDDGDLIKVYDGRKALN